VHGDLPFNSHRHERDHFLQNPFRTRKTIKSDQSVLKVRCGSFFASLKSQQRIAIDNGSCVIYVSDTVKNQICKILSEGTLPADTGATQIPQMAYNAASFYQPYGVAKEADKGR
jgi:hypothetical protein